MEPLLPYDVYKVVKKKLSYTVRGFEHTQAHKVYGWDGTKTVLYKNQTAPSGCTYRIKRILEKDFGINCKIEFEHNYPAKGKIGVYGFELKDFQEEAVKRIVKYRRGIVQAAVRAGKTAIIAATINRIGHFPVWVVTKGKDLVNQTRKDLEYHLEMPVGFFSEGKYDHSQVMVTSYEALGRSIGSALKAEKGKAGFVRAKTQARNRRILHLVRTAKVVLFDECHHAVSPESAKVVAEFQSAGYVVGLSGTPKPEGKHSLEVEACIGSIIFRVQFGTLIKHKRLARPKIVLYRLPYGWFTTNIREYADVRAANIIENPYRNKFIAEIAVKLQKANKTTFVMIRNLDHGPILRALIPRSTFVHGNIDSKVRAELYKALQEKRIACIIATVGKEGLNIPKLDAVINAEGGKSSVATVQKMRSLTATEGKKYGIIVDFIDKGKFLNKHSKRRKKIYEGIQNAKIIEKKVKANYYPLEEGSRWQVLT